MAFVSICDVMTISCVRWFPLLLVLVPYSADAEVIKIQDTNYKGLVDDITRFCYRGYTADYFTPYGAGVVDGRMVMIASSSFHGNCTIRIQGQDSAEGMLYNVILVIEVYNYRKAGVSFCKGNVTHIRLFAGNRTMNLCPEFRKVGHHQAYVNYLPSDQIKIHLDFNDFAGFIKITFTSARYLGDHGRCLKNEITCLIRKKMLCIDSRLKCDGRINCGLENSFDENPNECQMSILQNFLSMTSYGLLLLLMLILFITTLLRMCVPRVADDFFIFNEDEDNKLLLTTESRPPRGANQEYLNALSERYK